MNKNNRLHMSEYLISGVASWHKVVPMTGYVSSGDVPKFTEKQKIGWVETVDILREMDIIVPMDAGHQYWTVKFGDDDYIDATFTDSEFYVQILMDVYGHAEISWAELDWIHIDSNGECDCAYCEEKYRD